MAGEDRQSDSDLEDEADAQHLAALGSLIFLPGFAFLSFLVRFLGLPRRIDRHMLMHNGWCRLKQWALSTMGFTSAQVFGAWKQFVQVYGGAQQRIGAFLNVVNVHSARLRRTSQTRMKKQERIYPRK